MGPQADLRNNNFIGRTVRPLNQNSQNEEKETAAISGRTENSIGSVQEINKPPLADALEQFKGKTTKLRITGMSTIECYEIEKVQIDRGRIFLHVAKELSAFDRMRADFDSQRWGEWIENPASEPEPERSILPASQIEHVAADTLFDEKLYATEDKYQGGSELADSLREMEGQAIKFRTISGTVSNWHTSHTLARVITGEHDTFLVVQSKSKLSPGLPGYTDNVTTHLLNVDHLAYLAEESGSNVIVRKNPPEEHKLQQSR